jgi:hypothetical protein
VKGENAPFVAFPAVIESAFFFGRSRSGTLTSDSRADLARPLEAHSGAPLPATCGAHLSFLRTAAVPASCSSVPAQRNSMSERGGLQSATTTALRAVLLRQMAT